MLRGIDLTRDQLLENTRRFANGLPANNALLWGARGMGKSSLVKAAHKTVNAEVDGILKVIEIHREDISSLPALMTLLRKEAKFRFIVFCDDLSFDAQDTSYKSLKAALDGGLEGRPDNVIFYATSNRRHLLPRDMIENERSTAINPSEAVQEKVSLSDRFGLWLGFHNCSQDEFFAMLEGYAAHYGLKISTGELHAAAVEWSVTRGSPLRPRGLATHSGPGGQARSEARANPTAVENRQSPDQSPGLALQGIVPVGGKSVHGSCR